MPRAYGASKRQEMVLVSLPASLPYLFAAMRLAAPRALLGVMIAEWLATGRGLGNLLNQSRGYLDYGIDLDGCRRLRADRHCLLPDRGDR